MNRLTRTFCITLASVLPLVPLAAVAQQAPQRAIVSIYRVAPGKQLAYLKWMAARDAVDKEAGVPATQWYAHMDGDSWDYIAVAPYVDDATSDRLDGIARKRGLKAGPAAGLELREYMASHTDTIAAGPMTASEMVSRVSAP